MATDDEARDMASESLNEFLDDYETQPVAPNPPEWQRLLPKLPPRETVTQAEIEADIEDHLRVGYDWDNAR